MARTTKPAQPETHERATTNTEQGLFFIILLLFILLQCLGWVSVSALQTNAPVYKMNFITLDYFVFVNLIFLDCISIDFHMSE